MIRAVVNGTGFGVPPRVVTNDDIAAMGVDTTDEWIVQRTGIRERRLIGPEDSSGSLAIRAARMAMEAGGHDPAEIGLVVLATITPDQPWPATACRVQDEVGLRNAGAFDLSAACAGFVYGLDLAAAQIESGRMRKALVVGVDVLTQQVDWTDRATCVLFGDGAGAVVLEAHEGTDQGVIASVLRADGSGTPELGVEVGGSRWPRGAPHSEGKREQVYQNGREVFRFAVKAMPDACARVLAKAGLTPDDVDVFVPHQANMRIIESASERLGIPMAKVYTNLQKYGNTSGGSIPLALAEAEREGRIANGSLVLTVGFGGGLVWGANLTRW